MTPIYLLLILVAVATGELDFTAPVILKHKEFSFSSLWSSTNDEISPGLINGGKNEVICKKQECVELLHNSCLKNMKQKTIKPYWSLCNRGDEFTTSVVMNGIAHANVTSSKEAERSELNVVLGDRKSLSGDFNFTRTDNQIQFRLTTDNKVPRATFFDGLVERKNQENIDCLRMNFAGQGYPTFEGPFMILMGGNCL